MRTRWIWLTLLVTAACSGGGENSSGDGAVAGALCEHFGEVKCGTISTGWEAVLQCGSQGVWDEETCPQACVLYNMQPMCTGIELDQLDESSESDIVVTDVGQDLLDAVEDNSLPDVKEELSPDAEEDKQTVEIPVDWTPPTVLSTSPADGEMGVSIPFTVRVVFSEPMYAVTVAAQTVKMYNAEWVPVDINFEWEDEQHTTLLITPAIAIFGTSAYTVELGSMISDLVGLNLGNPVRFTFYTGLQVSHTYYKELAAQFVPLIYAGTETGNAQFDYPTRYNLDGNWEPMDNVDYIKTQAQQVLPSVYCSVVESRTHYFITYMFYFPFRHTELAEHEFGNDVSGSLVVIRKSDNQPVAVETYFKNQSDDERSISYITDDSGFVASGQTLQTSDFDGMVSRSTLFPNNHYIAWLSPRKHESCLWIDENNSIYDGCVLYPAYKPTLPRLEMKYGAGNATPITKQGGTFPATLSNVDFELLYILEQLWPRRSDVGQNEVFSSSYEYEPYVSNTFSNRPVLATEVGSSFAEPVGHDNARPPWAWRYFPQDGSSFYQMPRGVVFLDPAVHFRRKHDPSLQWNAAGWSIEYCFNPYFNVDFRGIWSDCSNP